MPSRYCASDRPSAMEASNAASFRSLQRNQGSILVMSWISSTVTPDFSASNTVKSL